MEETELETLVSALNKAASVLQDTLRQERLPPFDSTDPSPHPWDDGLPSPTGWYARKAILGLCHRIISLVQNPIERSVADQFSLSLLSSMNAVAQARPTVAEIVLKSGSSGVELAEVAFRSGINATKLSSIMHVLTSWDYFKETSAGRYAPTRSSRALLPDAPVANLSGTTNAGMEAASTLALTAKMPSDSGHPTPFDVYHKVNFYGWLQENPELSDEFNRGMKDWERIADPGLVVDLPVEDLGTHITLVDVGSGFGALAMQFLKQYPGWQAVLQDQPAVISEAESFWKREASEIVEAGRVSFLGHSFFEPTVLPPAREGSPYVFMIKSVLHNWPDDLAANILENLLPAAPPGTVLLIVNYTPAEPQDAATSLEDFFNHISGHSMSEIQRMSIVAPALIGAGWGYGDACVSLFDATMMLLFSARCRTASDFKDLLQGTSWKFESKTDYRGATSVIRAKRV